MNWIVWFRVRLKVYSVMFFMLFSGLVVKIGGVLNELMRVGLVVLLRWLESVWIVVWVKLLVSIMVVIVVCIRVISMVFF